MSTESCLKTMFSFPITQDFWNYSKDPLFSKAKVPLTPIVAIFDLTIGRFVTKAYQKNKITKEYNAVKVEYTKYTENTKKDLKIIAYTLTPLAIGAIFNASIMMGMLIGTCFPSILLFGLGSLTIKPLILKKLFSNNKSSNPKVLIPNDHKIEEFKNLKNQLTKQIKNQVLYPNLSNVWLVTVNSIVVSILFMGVIQPVLKTTITYLFPSISISATTISILATSILLGLSHLPLSPKEGLAVGSLSFILNGVLIKPYSPLAGIACHITTYSLNLLAFNCAYWLSTYTKVNEASELLEKKSF